MVLQTDIRAEMEKDKPQGDPSAVPPIGTDGGPELCSVLIAVDQAYFSRYEVLWVSGLGTER